MFNPYLGELMATGKYSTATGAMVASFFRGAALAYSAVGVATVTPDRQVDSTECTLGVGVQTASLFSTWEDTSDTVKTIKTWDDAGVAAEGAVSFSLWRVTGGAGR